MPLLWEDQSPTTNHQPQQCYFIDSNSWGCGEKGYIAAMCYSKKQQRMPAKTNIVGSDLSNAQNRWINEYFIIIMNYS